jgi:hypothetical protein
MSYRFWPWIERGWDIFVLGNIGMVENCIIALGFLLDTSLSLLKNILLPFLPLCFDLIVGNEKWNQFRISTPQTSNSMSSPLSLRPNFFAINPGILHSVLRESPTCHLW